MGVCGCSSSGSSIRQNQRVLLGNSSGILKVLSVFLIPSPLRSVHCSICIRSVYLHSTSCFCICTLQITSCIHAFRICKLDEHTEQICRSINGAVIVVHGSGRDERPCLSKSSLPDFSAAVSQEMWIISFCRELGRSRTKEVDRRRMRSSTAWSKKP